MMISTKQTSTTTTRLTIQPNRSHDEIRGRLLNTLGIFFDQKPVGSPAKGSKSKSLSVCCSETPPTSDESSSDEDYDLPKKTKTMKQYSSPVPTKRKQPQCSHHSSASSTPTSSPAAAAAAVVEDTTNSSSTNDDDDREPLLLRQAAPASAARRSSLPDCFSQSLPLHSLSPSQEDGDDGEPVTKIGTLPPASEPLQLPQELLYQETKTIHFFPLVSVVDIPSHRDYSDETHDRMWNSSHHISINRERSCIEYIADDCDWRKATEEGSFIAVQGELYHPATYREMRLVALEEDAALTTTTRITTTVTTTIQRKKTRRNKRRKNNNKRNGNNISSSKRSGATKTRSSRGRGRSGGGGTRSGAGRSHADTMVGALTRFADT